MRTLVLGIGNSILGDDGVGVRVAQAVASKIKDDSIDVMDVNVDGLNLFDFILGYDRLVVIDAIVTEDGEIGEIYRLKPEQICSPSGSAISPHHYTLASTIEIGNRLFPREIPQDVVVFAINTEDASLITEEMSPKVREAVPKAVNLVLEEVGSI
jgi:hydrogenase maturation protease